MARRIQKRPDMLSGLFSGGGGGIRTPDLWVMSPTSYHCSTPRRIDSHQEGREGSQRPRLPWTRSTVLSGAEVGHDRVRDGTGWVHLALGHEPTRHSWGNRRWGRAGAPAWGMMKSDVRWWWIAEGNKARVRERPSSAMSTARLRSVARRPPAASQPGHLPGALLNISDGDSRLGEGFPLRCFQRFARPNVATQRCRLPDNWYTSGSSNPVLSY